MGPAQAGLLPQRRHGARRGGVGKAGTDRHRRGQRERRTARSQRPQV
ncbi:MAG: hypothetical protein AVDCRST_MAG68-1806 [uncultured Gemmatimonadetes bacterium]|uniref:Uncharacterized protein n=1 Tax=uncultured Gemmatimonadota bacterium TaxID=203437 RepID=A0A6J4K451_9BACT|nr:MAG: hypothetical protein AVDCRST_MAG68-1806 [uncultured Gemmatimonadota bacterium]